MALQPPSSPPPESYRHTPWSDALLLQGTPLVLVRLDRAGRLVSLSPGWEALSGFTVAESLGRDYLAFLHSDDHDACRRIAEQLLGGTRELGTGVVRLLRRDRESRHLEVRLFALPDAAGDGPGLGGTVLDVSRPLAGAPSRLRTGAVSAHDVAVQLYGSDAARQAATRALSLVERAAFGVFRCTPEGVLIDVNPSLADMLGHDSPAALVGRNLFCDIGVNEAIGPRLLADVLRDDVREWYDLECTQLNGQLLLMRLGITVERGENGELEALLGVAENVTERMKREEIVRRGERMAALGRTLAGVAHEINNPLAAISGFAQILLKREQSADDQHALDTILHEARRAARVVKDLLTVARREEAGGRTRVDVNAVIHYIVGTQRYAMSTRGIHEELDLAAENPHVLADPAQIEQVVLNLVVNARQALEAELEARLQRGDTAPRRHPPLLRVTTRLSEGSMMLEVLDNGPGISAYDLSHIWDPFWTTREEGEGAGLGLSVVHGIVASHGGKIVVSSTAHVETRFTITLPHAVSPASLQRRGARHVGGSVVPASRPLDVLVIDDEAVIRGLLTRFLSSRGHAVLAAADGEHALRLAENASFDVVISDLRMPGIDGRELIRRLREIPSFSGTRYILSTGDAAAANSMLPHDSGGEIVIVNKPYDVDTLVDLVESG
ncbi:MAG: ATP-binding protein [Gemmatimonadaceae bacterium]